MWKGKKEKLGMDERWEAMFIADRLRREAGWGGGEVGGARDRRGSSRQHFVQEREREREREKKRHCFSGRPVASIYDLASNIQRKMANIQRRGNARRSKK